MIDFIPDPVAFTIGSFPVLWYGIFYAVGLAAVYFVLVHEARRRDEDPEIVGNALIIVAIAALIGGRLYHVIDQWARYKDDLITAILPITRNVADATCRCCARRRSVPRQGSSRSASASPCASGTGASGTSPSRAEPCSWGS